MIKKIIKDGYVVEFDKAVDLPKGEAIKLADKAIRFIAKKEQKDSAHIWRSHIH